MKTILTLMFGTFAALTASAQSFEGTISWSFKTEMTGDAAAQMSETQSMMNDPAVRAQIQAAMNDPQMRAMLEQNPQMKAMMDAAAGGGNAVDNLLPKGVTLKIKDGNTLSIVEGGMAPSETLSLADRNAVYSIDRANRTFTQINTGGTSTSNPSFKVTRTNETATILGYKCTRYNVEEGDGRSASSTYTIWSTTEIPGASARQLARMQVSRGGSAAFFSQIDGVPLRMEMSSSDMKMTMEATAVKRESLSDDLFQLPSGFTEQK